MVEAVLSAEGVDAAAEDELADALAKLKTPPCIWDGVLVPEAPAAALAKSLTVCPDLD
jgi:hypothetical protein